jgi:sulfoxide reductase heme-binding subunit YedZ
MTLVLLTASVVLGIAEWRAWRPAGASRFAVAAMHRTVSLLALALLAVHIATTALDPFPRIGVLNAVVPFVTSYRPLWIGMGTLAADLMLAIAVTSLVRRRLGYAAWRGVHWLSYACWPVALLHGLGAGSDTKSGWMLALTLACVAAVLAAAASRAAAAGTPRAARVAAAGAIGGLAAGLGIWLPQGPLAQGWAPRAGTPRSVLAAFNPRPARSRGRPRPQSFDAAVHGQIRNGLSQDGTGVVDLSMRLEGGPGGLLSVRLGGQALPDGGLNMQRSAVVLRSADGSGEYRGRVVALNSTDLRALVGGPGGRALRLHLSLTLGETEVDGQLHADPVTETRS